MYRDPEVRRAYARALYARNLEKRRAQARVHAARRRASGKQTKYAREWDTRNREKIAGYRCTYYSRYPGRKHLSHARRQSKKLGLAFDLTPEWYVAEYAKGCALSGLTFAPPTGDRDRCLVASIDRVKAGGDYTQSNCRLILFSLNSALNDWGLEKALPIWRAVLERNAA